MHPNTAALARVYAREKGSTVSDQSFSVANDFEIVVEAEAGSTIFNDGGGYSVDVILFDKKQVTNITLTQPLNTTGNMMGAGWPAQVTQFVYTVPKANLAGRAGHTCDLSASLQVGAGAEPGVSDAEGPTIHLHA